MTTSTCPTSLDRDGETEIITLFVDDSAIARKRIEHTLKTLTRKPGGRLWKIAEEAEPAGQSVKGQVRLVLTDIEMPEMDGYMLTRRIKGRQAFRGKSSRDALFPDHGAQPGAGL